MLKVAFCNSGEKIDYSITSFGKMNFEKLILESRQPQQ